MYKQASISLIKYHLSIYKRLAKRLGEKSMNEVDVDGTSKPARYYLARGPTHACMHAS